MNLEQMKARLAAILAKLEEYKAVANYSAEDITNVNALSEEFEGLKAQIETQEKIEVMTAKAGESTRKVTPLAAVNVDVGVNRQALDPSGGFKSQGEFFKAVANAASGRIDKRLTVQGAMQEKVGEEGGFLIPGDFRQEIQKKVTGDESLLSRCRQFQTASNTLVLPTNEVAPWDGTGVQAYWEGESASYVESKTKFGEANLRLHKLTSLVRVTEELLEDAPALESWIKGEAPGAMLHKVNSAIIAGSGAGMPMGILNSTFKYKVAAESGQTASTINFANINNMLGRILPASFAKSVWIVNPAVLPQLRAMKFDLTSSTPIPVYMPPAGVADAPYGTLYGRPILPMMGAVKALGVEGDIALIDFSYYYAAIKTTGIKSDVSTHVYFLTQESAFRFSMRIAGQCPFKAPISTENGSFQMSAFVTLADR